MILEIPKKATEVNWERVLPLKSLFLQFLLRYQESIFYAVSPVCLGEALPSLPLTFS